MNENIKTLAFAGVATVAIVLAWISAPEGRDASSGDNKMGQSLFGEFDPRAATGIRIVEIDEDALDTKSIEIAQSDRGWFIKRPGKADYPADADNQLEDVSTILFDVLIHDVAGEGKGEHPKFGVLDPNEAKPGDDEGVGKYITLKNSSGSSLAELVIGDEVKGLSGLRYVRKPNENTVYMAELQNVNDVSTKFIDWVEKDFLDLDKWDVKRVTLDNYDIDKTKNTLVEAKRQVGRHILDYESSEWKLSGSHPLATGEDLNKTKLDDLKDALDDLEIIDVESKPEILASSLRQGNEFASVKSQQEFLQVRDSLRRKGFYVDAKPGGTKGELRLSVISEKGEILVGMKDGVEYVLRFGDVYRGPEDDENATGDSRYIYAFARVNESLLDQPALEIVPPPLPEIPAPVVVPGTPANEANATLLPPAPVPDSNEGGQKAPKGRPGARGKKGTPPSTTPPPPPASLKPPSPPPTSLPPTPPVGVPGTTVSATDSNATTANDSNTTAEYAKKRAERNREIATKTAANASKQKEYAGKVAKARKEVNELNERLAGWYYVISNDVYEKIRLERADFVEKKVDGNATTRPEEVRASHILVSYKGADRADAGITRTKAEAKKRAVELHAQIVGEGKDFAEVARKNSDGPSSTKGGDLGKFKFETMAKPFSEAAFTLEVGAVSEVVETGFGFHVIKRTE